MKRIVIASLATALLMTACATETTTDEVVTTTEPTVEIVETIVVTEPTIETEPIIEVTEPIVETEPVEVTEPEETETNELGTTYLGEFKLTAYCACSKCCGKSDGITATGTKATQGRTIAVDPKLIPYGSEVIINGHTYVAEDCGGAIKSKKIDIYFDSHREALNFGVRYADVYLVNRS